MLLINSGYGDRVAGGPVRPLEAHFEIVVHEDLARIIRENSSCEVMCYLTSLAPHVRFIAEAVRSHWEMDNKVHWVLDATYQEDHFRIRRGEGTENIGRLHR